MYRKQKYILTRDLEPKNFDRRGKNLNGSIGPSSKHNLVSDKKIELENNKDKDLIKRENLIQSLQELWRKPSTQSIDDNKLCVDNINQRVLTMQYAVRGELVTLAEKMQKEISEGKRNDFDQVVFCNIGNPHAVGQKPITYIRQVLSLCQYPELLENPNIDKLYPTDIIERAKNFIKKSKNGTGAYTNGRGLDFVIEDVANFIEKRDGYRPDLNNIFLTNGASEGIQMFLNTIIRNNLDGVLLPIPQYPLYSALMVLLGGSKVSYYLDEDKNWGLSIDELQRAINQARIKGVSVRAIVVINPGNPTGNCLDIENMKDIIKFCHREGLILIADEVYQENVYMEGKKFTSFRKVLLDMGPEYNDVQLFSCHSTSKGFLGECGHRGGYFEIMNISEEVRAQIYKLACTRLCPNTIGQFIVSMMTNPPKPNEPSYDLFQEERNSILSKLKQRSIMLTKELNTMEGISCQQPQGAMYIFPSIVLPPKLIEEAERTGKQPDFIWAKAMLEDAGVCVIPGSGFGQKPNTYHFRTTFLADENVLKKAIERMKIAHAKLLAKYA